MQSQRPEYDAIIVGGGPAGASSAAWLSRRGRRVLVVERQRFPRFHIGESLLPETNRCLKAIGARERIAAAGFVVKRDAILMAPEGGHEGYAFFADAEGVERPSTFEVPRDQFDQILLDHAAACGAEVLQECRAREVTIGTEGVEVRIEDQAGQHSHTGRFLVDASGRDGFLAKRLDLRLVDPELRQIGVHAWYQGVVPPPPERAGDIRIAAIDGEGWAWLIPLDDRVTNIGVVVSKERYSSLAASSPDERLDHLLASAPALPPLRQGLLPSGVPRPGGRLRRAPGPAPGGGHRAGGQFATLPPHPPAAAPLLHPGPDPAPPAVRAPAPRPAGAGASHALNAANAPQAIDFPETHRGEPPCPDS